MAAVLTDGDTADSDAFIAQVDSIYKYPSQHFLAITILQWDDRYLVFKPQGELEMKKGSDGKKSLYFFDKWDKNILGKG